MKVPHSSLLFFSAHFLALDKEGLPKVPTWRFVDEGTANPALFVHSISTQLNGDPS
jgi:hypothetical protein